MRQETVKQLIIEAWPRFDVVTAKELTEAGIGERLRSTAVRLDILQKLRRGAYVRSDIWQGCTTTATDLMRIRAHFLTTPHAGAYSHVTAARLHGLHIWDVPPTVHLTQGFSSNRTASGADTRTYNQRLPPNGVVSLPGPRAEKYTVTSPERTVLDCARTLELHRAVIIGDHALREGADAEVIASALAELDGQRGISRARSAFELMDRRAESPGETRARLLFDSFDITMPESQPALTSRLGKHRGDFAWRDIKLIAEFDGKGKYFDYKPTDQAIYQEREREKALMEEDWTFFRIGWSDLSEPATLKTRLLTAMAKATAWTEARAR